jgi:transcriptional regulator with XRE-family HTH domain
MPQNRAAERASVTRQSYAQLETSEERGTISIDSLRRAARALDCELVYFIVPAGSKAGTYAELAAAHDPVAGQLRATEHSMSLGGQGSGGGSGQGRK